jgi:hypothetical protein
MTPNLHACHLAHSEVMQLGVIGRLIWRSRGKPNIRVASRKVVYPTCWGQHTKVKSSALGSCGEGRGHSSSP